MPETTEEELTTFIVGWLAEQLRREVGRDASFATLGLDSLDVVRLTDALADRMKVDELPVSIVLEHPTVAALAAHLATAPK